MLTEAMLKTAEFRRLQEDADRKKYWKRWGPYLSERQWGTVREDYSEGGNCWEYFPHDHARSRAYRWGEDGLLGISDRQCRICFALALWNGNDPILKERLFGLVNAEGNHGEDVKECYYYLDSTPTHSYMRARYKYPQAEYPYARLVEENRRRGMDEPEFELTDTGIFDDQRYFDIEAEYAKADEEDLCIRIHVSNRGPEAAPLHLLPTLWCRNTWSFDHAYGGGPRKPVISEGDDGSLRVHHADMGTYRLDAAPLSGAAPERIFTENDSNTERLYGVPPASPHTKDAFHEYVVRGRTDAVNPMKTGTKAAFVYTLNVPAGATVSVSLRLRREKAAGDPPFASAFSQAFDARRAEADAFYDAVTAPGTTADRRAVLRQAYAGLLWSKQFFYYVVQPWLEGDPDQPPPPEARKRGRNSDWSHVHCRDILSMPDTWEYPWFAAWDLAFHTISFAEIDPFFAKNQLELFLREWYLHPNGQIPAYEFAFSDVNPPVHAWACWRVYKMTGKRGGRDRLFLERVFHKLLLNFTWWVNRKDPNGRNVFSGGFLGLDNIGVFDRSQPLPTGGELAQADGTAWMAFYCGTMLSMALELARENPAYEDIASKFLEHFIAIADAINHFTGSGLWDDQDGFYYDQIWFEGHAVPLKVRSLVGVIPLFAVEILEQDAIDQLPGFKKRLNWFVENRKDLEKTISYFNARGGNNGHDHRLMAIPRRDQLERMLRYLLDPKEFLSDYGVRAVSKFHEDHPYVFHDHGSGRQWEVRYTPGESTSGLFGGNSNWRGPIWFPLNYLIVEALERYHHFYGESFTVEFPAGSGRSATLKEVAAEISDRLVRIFLPEGGRRPVHGVDARYAEDPHWRDLVLFYEYFHGDNGRGVGASHQTGWTALVTRLINRT